MKKYDVRRAILGLAAAGGLALGLAAGPATAASAATSAEANASFKIHSAYDGGYVWYNASPQDAAVEPLGITHGAYDLVTIGASGKWAELETIDGYCLDQVGPYSGVYYVREEFCNSRAGEMWWWTSPHSNGIYEIINSYGTSLFNHYACLWDQDGASPNGPIWKTIVVRKCASTPPNNQNWTKS
jgi:hypothetical protein